MWELGRSRTLVAGLTAAAALAMTIAGPAPAGQASTNTIDITGDGSATTRNLFGQFAVDYNKQHPRGLLHIVISTSCQLAGPLRDGPAEASSTCDFYGSDSGRSTSDRSCAAGGICFVGLAGNAVTWAARDTASGGTDAPASLTTEQLAKIYECKDTNWAQVGGKDAPIQAFLPQTSSSTRTLFLTALGGGTTPITPGACASDENNTLEENEGINPLLNSPEAIFIYSVGTYIAQAFHSAACINAGCTPTSSGTVCTPATGQNLYGCDETGVLGLQELNGSKPTTPWPPAANSTINKNFDLAFQRTLYDVVVYGDTADHIPAYLEPIFAAATAVVPGWICTNATAIKDIKDYGFLPTWHLSSCGATS